jgi:subtilisin-like proprotein convertase family protein
MSTIFVDKDFKISDLNVRLNVSHTAVGDLNVVLLSPNFTPYVLMMGRGGNGDNLNGTLFDDQAAVSVANGVAPFSGSFKPESALVALNGQGAKGGWTLVISDTLYGDKGELKNWSLEFNTVAPAANNLKRAIVRASVLGATVAGVAPIWKGGALLSIDSGAVSNPVASPPEAMPQTRALEASSIARNRMAGFLDQMIWSRLADELIGSRKK